MHITILTEKEKQFTILEEKKCRLQIQIIEGKEYRLVQWEEKKKCRSLGKNSSEECRSLHPLMTNLSTLSGPQPHLSSIEVKSGKKQKQRMSNISSLEFSLKKKPLSVKVGQSFWDIEIVLQSPSASLSLSLSAFPQMLLVCTPCLAQVWTLHQMWRDLRRSTLVSK